MYICVCALVCVYRSWLLGHRGELLIYDESVCRDVCMCVLSMVVSLLLNPVTFSHICLRRSIIAVISFGHVDLRHEVLA